jgi:hypothetical protein
MTNIEPVETTNLDIYGNTPMPWSRAQDGLATALPKVETAQFLATVDPDGRPHSAGIGGLWQDGTLYFTSGPGTRKSRNLTVNAACTFSARLGDLDLVMEGEAQRVTDLETLERVSAQYRQGGWPTEVDSQAGGFTAPFSAPSAGRPPWYLYRFILHTAFGVATAEPYGATKWRFTG